MSINIDHYPNKFFYLSSLFSTHDFKIDLNQSVKEKLGEKELTNTLALKIFKQIKLKSDILSILTKPIVFTPLSVAVIAFGLALPLPTTGVVLTAIAITAMCTVCFLGGSMLGLSIREPYNNFLSQLSQAYSDQSKRAAEYIRELESSKKEFVFTLA